MREFQSWCETVMKQVRFRPDRPEIARELEAHYEDHVKDLERLGYDRALAEERALKAMGDPEAVGKAMDRVHKPWVGWLWLASKWCLIVCLGVTVCLGIRGEWRNIYQGVQYLLEEPTDYEENRMFFTIGDPERFVRLAWKSCDEVYERCGYTLKVPYAAIWKSTYEGEDHYWFSAVMTAENWKFWEEGPKFKRTIWLSSSEGRNIGPYVDLSQTDSYMSAPHESLFQTTFEISAWLDDELPEWVELSCPYGEGFTFHIGWEEVRE